MSLSNQKDKGQGAWGTIYSQGREHSLNNIEQGRSTAWSPADEENYLARVRHRASEMAARILTDAKKEAENIKQAAYGEGYAEGIENAKAELDDFRSGMGEAVSAVLGAIEGQCSQIFQDWRDDILALASLCVEKVTAAELSENPKAVLDGLPGESVAQLEQRKPLVMRVGREDEAVLSDIVGLAQGRCPDVKSGRVKGDGTISPGGMVVESESSLAEGRVESRMAAVDAILQNLVLTDSSMPEVSAPAQHMQQPAAMPAPSRATPTDSSEPDMDTRMQSASQTTPEAYEQNEAESPHSLASDEAVSLSAPVEMAQLGQAGAELAADQAEQPMPGTLPGIDLNDPNLSQEEINAALEAMLAAQSDGN